MVQDVDIGGACPGVGEEGDDVAAGNWLVGCPSEVQTVPAAEAFRKSGGGAPGPRKH